MWSNSQFSVAHFFCWKTLSKMFDRILTTPLGSTFSFSKTQSFQRYFYRKDFVVPSSVHFCLMILTEKNCILLTLVQEWLLSCFWPFSYVYTINLVLYISLSRIENRCLKNMIYQRDSKNVWLLLSASFLAKFELDFFLNT